ncbi:MAG: PadR family transcriptional regulator [Streptosporangiaceae bacterium]
MAVLELLHERPMHPYEMHQLTRDRHTDQVVKIKAGSLYHTVERLQQQGLIEPVETSREGRRPERTVYAITGDGRDAFASTLSDMLREPVREYPVFAAAAAFMHTLPRDEVIQLLARRAVRLEGEIAAFNTVLEGLVRGGLSRLHVVEVEYLQALRRAELDWVRSVLDDLRSGRLRWLVGQGERENGEGREETGA